MDTITSLRRRLWLLTASVSFHLAPMPQLTTELEAAVIESIEQELSARLQEWTGEQWDLSTGGRIDSAACLPWSITLVLHDRIRDMPDFSASVRQTDVMSHVLAATANLLETRYGELREPLTQRGQVTLLCLPGHVCPPLSPSTPRLDWSVCPGT